MKYPYSIKLRASCLSVSLFSCLQFFIFTPASAAVINYGADSQQRGYLTLSGSIKYGDGARFNNIIKNLTNSGFHPEYVYLNSNGGSVNESNYIIQAMVKHQLSSIVSASATCASACFSIFASGHNRYAARSSQLGVHRAAIMGRDTDAARSASIDMLEILERHAVPESVQLGMVKTAPGQMYWLTPQEKEQMRSIPSPQNTLSNYISQVGLDIPKIRISAADRRRARDLNATAIKQIRAKNYSSAIANLEESKHIYPADSEVLGNLGYAYYMNHDYHNAELNLTSSLRIKPDRGSSWNNLGMVMAATGRGEWAEKSFIKYWNHSSNKKAATGQLYYWRNDFPDTLLSKTAASVITRLGL